MAQSWITKFFVSFITEHGSEEMLETWNDEKNMKAFNAVFAKAKRGKKLKDPKAPKRGKNSYILFCAKKREEAKALLGDHAKATDVTSKLGEMWTTFKASKKPTDQKALKALEEESIADKARFEEEMKEYEPPSDDELANIKKKKTSDKDPNAPKRARSAYILFCTCKREDAKKSGEGNVMTRLGQMWKELKEDKSRAGELAAYESAAAADKVRYEEEKKGYTSPHETDKSKKGKSQVIAASDDELVPDDLAEIVKGKKTDKKGKKTDKTDNADLSKKGKKTDDSSPKKKMTGYVYYCNYFRDELKTENPEMKGGEINKELARQWKELTKEQKKEWSDSAELE